MKNKIYVLKSCLVIVLGIVNISKGTDNMNDDTLKANIKVDSDNFTAKTAISFALENHKTDILLAAMDNRNWDIKTNAVEAIAKLPSREAAQTFVALLGMDRLWSNHAKGGEAEILQDHFNTVLKSCISKNFNLNLSSSDLFDSLSRHRLIGSLKTHAD